MENKKIIFAPLVAMFLIAPTLAAAPLAIQVDTGIDREHKPPRIEVDLIFVDKEGNEGDIQILWKDQPAARNPKSYHLFAKLKDKDTKEEVPIEVLQTSSSDAAKAQVRLVTSSQLKTDVTYTFRVDKDAHLRFLVPGQSGPVEYEPPKDDIPLDAKDVTMDEEYLGLIKSLQPKAEILGGSGGGDGSFYLSYPLNRISDGWLHLDASAKGDFNLRSEDRTKYFNNLNAQVKGFYSDNWGDCRTGFCGYFELGVDARVETDQVFDNVNATFGPTVALRVKNPLTTWLHHLLVPNINEAGTAPLFFLSYDYVDHIEKEQSVESGTNRFRGDFYWNFPVARGISKLKDWGFSQQLFDADFIIDVETIYDFDKSKFTDNTKLTLSIQPQTASDKAPSFTLTYAQGKATPTFKNFDAFLAGLKIPF